MTFLSRSRWRLALVSLLLASGLVDQSAAAEPALPLRDADRIAWLGSTFVERMQNDGYLETILTSTLPQQRVSFRNLGWSGDTVWGDSRGVFGDRSDGFKRLINDTLTSRPTVIALVYGQNEAFAGPKGLAEFKAGLATLIDALAPSQARILLIAPPQAQPVQPPLPPVDAYNEHLAEYARAIEQIAKERQLSFLNWYSLDVPRDAVPPLSLTSNGLHWTPAGQWVLAPLLARSLGGDSAPIQLRVDGAAKRAKGERAEVAKMNFSSDRLSFEVTPHVLPPPRLPLKNAAGALPAQEFFARPFARLQVTGLPSATYEVRVGELPPQSADAKQLAAGVDLLHSPDDERVERMRSLIEFKNELFFHRYRPQNETYLFLFRKHEQGNNAVEIPQFDPLIEAKEKEIFELRSPRSFTCVVTRSAS